VAVTTAAENVRDHLMRPGTGGSAWHASLRPATDPTLEDASGVGAPPWTWSRRDQLVDVGHKTSYSLVTERSPTGSSRCRPTAGPDGTARDPDEAGS
jgi:hypothetical protein